MDMFDGFVFLEEKKKSLIPILCQYDFLSALTAAFSITSWRKNRGAQESCLALNSAMVENTEWGRKTIFTPNDLEEFFQLLYPILKTTPYDDPVLPDFGEIKLNYRSKYYSVITGTGHTAPIFSALQFLEKISESACMDAYTDSLLCYSDYCIDFLKAKNTPINEDFSLHPQFESPTFDYYENVKDFMTEEKWTGLGTPLLSMLAAESNVYSEVDTSAAHIFSHYLELGGVFPFHLSSTIFADPECWNVICDDNSVYQFTRKVKALPGGALFKYDNGCSVFLSYNFFSILKESNITQSRLSLDMFRAVTEKFFIEYHQDLSAIPPLANTLVQFCCHSLSNQNPEHYVCCQKAKVSSNKLVVDFEVNSSKIASDIAEAIDRSVEYSVIGELLQPLVCLSKDSYSELFEKMELTSGQKKTLGTTAVRIDYYFNPDTYEIKETDVSELSIRKQIAKICAAAGVLPGTYERRDATEIVRKIQESVVSHLEQAIRTLERDRLHILLLSALATEQLSVNLNRTGATLTEDIEEGERIKSLEKSTQLSEKAKMRKSALLYLIETNLYLVNERKEEAIDSSKLSELLSFAKWIIYLQNSSDLCFHTDSDTKLIVEDDYRIDVELGENYSQTFEKESQRRIIAEPFNLRGDNTDRDFFEKVANACCSYILV